tara:strand:+ start:232 stop:549 length:318 start_codon:yes stop_codon:yes gene_type:complete
MKKAELAAVVSEQSKVIGEQDKMIKKLNIAYQTMKDVNATVEDDLVFNKMKKISSKCDDMIDMVGTTYVEVRGGRRYTQDASKQFGYALEGAVRKLQKINKLINR